MIGIERAKAIAKKEYDEYPIYSITDIGDRWAFSFDSGDPPAPGTPILCVNKETGSVDYLPIPPLENLDIIENGTLIE